MVMPLSYSDRDPELAPARQGEDLGRPGFEAYITPQMRAVTPTSRPGSSRTTR